MRRTITAILLGLLAALPTYAQPGRYSVEGVGPEGAYQGTAVVTSLGKRQQVALRTLDDSGRERHALATARTRKRSMRFTCQAIREGNREQALRVNVRPLAGDPGSLVATYKDGRGRVVRRECWLPTRVVRVPLQIVALQGRRGFPGVSVEEAKQAQVAVVRQLNAVFGGVDVEFTPVTEQPVMVDGTRFDTDRDGKLSTQESRPLRSALELQGLKRRGRVVLVLTDAPFAQSHGECRGWTLGDAPATPRTLTDLNDNLSLVGMRYLDARRFHTVAHEVAHQLGLDDLNPQNRKLLNTPRRTDHLMASGGRGLHLDREAARLIRTASLQFPSHGLEGRVGNPLASSRLDSVSLPASARREGLPAPASRR